MDTITPQPTADTLNTVMDFDHVIHVAADGTVSDVNGVYAPELVQWELADGTWPWELQAGGKAWELVNGYSGQQGYRGPLMHQSEIIGGRLADDILSGERPGYYVAIYPAVDDINGEQIDAYTWAVAYLPTEA